MQDPCQLGIKFKWAPKIYLLTLYFEGQEDEALVREVARVRENPRDG